MNNPEKIEKDAIKKLEEFLNSSKDKNEPMSTGTMLFESYEGPRIDSLFKDASCIRTNASEQPTGDGGYKYNGFTTYDFIYALTDDNKLLVIKQVGNIASTCIPVRITFRLYPNAEDYKLNITAGHDEKGYLIIKDMTGRQVNCYYYERPDSDLFVFNGYPIKDVIDTTNMTQLIAEYKERVNNKTMGR